jgi:hypothetical protein
MMGPRWLALPLATVMGTGCATAPAPRMLSADLHIGSLDDRTSFELDDRSTPAREDEGDGLDDLRKPVDSPKQQRVRRLLYLTGIGAIGFGIVGTVAFGIGGRIVQAQMKHGYEDGDLTRARQEQLSTTGTAMNAMAITSAVIGLAGVIVAATVYGVDHNRCGELRPRRKQCPHHDPGSGITTGAPADGGTTDSDTEPSEASGASSEAGGANEADDASETPAEAGGSHGAAGGTGPAASSIGPSPAPTGAATAPTEGSAPAAAESSSAGGKPASRGKRSSSAAKPGQ